MTIWNMTTLSQMPTTRSKQKRSHCTEREETKKVEPGVLFNQNTATAHMSYQALAAIRNSGFELLSCPLYLPDLAPNAEGLPFVS